MATCYRHPNRETGVSCSNCGNPICTDCMTTTPVGMRCPDCAKQKTPVKTVRSMYGDPVATYVLIAVNVLAYFGVMASGGSGSEVYGDAGLLGIGLEPAGLIGVAEGEWWRLLTGGFMHDARSPLHILFNMYALYFLGQILEPSMGTPKFLALYFASLLTGSFAVMLANPQTFTVGASGAVFGLMAAAVIIQYRQGIDPMQSGLGMILILNLGITFLIPRISIAGHIGGLIGGAIVALVFAALSQRSRSPGPAVGAAAALGVAAFVGGIVAAQAEKTDLGLALTSLF